MGNEIFRYYILWGSTIIEANLPIPSRILHQCKLKKKIDNRIAFNILQNIPPP